MLKELRGRNSRHFLLLFKLCSLWSLLKRVMKVEEDLVKALTDGNEHVLYSYNFCLFFNLFVPHSPTYSSPKEKMRTFLTAPFLHSQYLRRSGTEFHVALNGLKKSCVTHICRWRDIYETCPETHTETH